MGIIKTVSADPNAKELYTYHHLRVRPATGNLLVPAVDIAHLASPSQAVLAMGMKHLAQPTLETQGQIRLSRYLAVGRC